MWWTKVRTPAWPFCTVQAIQFYQYTPKERYTGRERERKKREKIEKRRDRRKKYQCCSDQ